MLRTRCRLGREPQHDHARIHRMLGFAPQPTDMARYSPIVSSEALPPAAVVLMVSVRSVAKRSR